MPKGHSANPEHIAALRALLAAEPLHGRIALAGIALAAATQHGEHASRAATAMIVHLRNEIGYADGDLLRLLSLPHKAYLHGIHPDHTHHETAPGPATDERRESAQGNGRGPAVDR
jgi:hypothetical protein